MAKDFEEVKIRGKTYLRFGVHGLDALDKDLERMGRELATQKGYTAVRASMMPVMGEVKTNLRTGAHSENTKNGAAIVDTGALLNSVKLWPASFAGHERTRRSGSVYTDVRAGLSGKRETKKGKKRPIYALQVEFGTEDSAFGPLPPQPFIRPAFSDAKMRPVAERLRQLLRNQIVRWKMTNKD